MSSRRPRVRKKKSGDNARKQWIAFSVILVITLSVIIALALTNR